MDNIDEWMKRTFGENLPKEAFQPEKQEKKPFVKQQQREFHHKKGGKRPVTGKPAEQKPHSAPHGAKQQHEKRHEKRPQRHSDGKPAGRRGQKGPRNSQVSIKAGPPPKMPHQKSKGPQQILKDKLKIIPLGGLNEVGKNMTAFEYENDIIIIDMGFEFPSEDLLGIDYVIPDISYLIENKKRIRGVLLTHAHLDHIGGIPYMLPKLDFPPVYGAKLTMGFVEHRIKEFNQEKMAKLITINPDQTIKLGQFAASFFRVMHSIPDALGIVLDTPAGKIVHTGDFKFDDYPARNLVRAEVDKIKALGKQNVLALFCESTNSLSPGHTISEKEVGTALEGIIGETDGRLIIAAFSSQVSRLQQIIDAAILHHRKIFVSGRSMRNTIDICKKLGYLDIPKDLIQDVKKYKNSVPDKNTLILTTGSQGEPVAALSRMAMNEHQHIKIKKGDTIVLSSSPIPGNERAISSVINQLCIMGAKIISNQIMDVHTSGHAKQDELVEMINYVQPKYLIPIHGEYYMRQGLGVLAQERCGFSEDRVIMIQNGDVLYGEKGGKFYKSKEQVETKYILIDGSGEGSSDSQVLVDREIMAQNGALIVLIYISKKGRKLTKPPDIISRGFVYMHESEEIASEIGHIAQDAYKRIHEKNPGADRRDVKRYIKQTIDKYTHAKLERKPLIIPLMVEV